VVVTIGINMVSGSPRNLQVPDVRGQAQADAIAALQNKGFKIHTNPKTDNTVPPDSVIDTDPPANSMASAGDDIAINVSVGPKQAEVPDCAALSATDCTQKLKDAGFTKFKQTTSASKPDEKDRVLQTLPPANQLSAITNEITIVIGSGPQNAEVPVVAGQTVEVAGQILTASGFLTFVPVPTDSTEPSGQVVGTDPPNGQTVPQDTPIQIKVSKGNQFVMPDVRGGFWADVEPRLRSLGWTGVLDKGADVQNSGQRSNAVVSQSPSPGSGVNFNATITLSFAS